MTKDEALRLALEFIPSINPAFICEASHHKKHEQHASNEPCPHVAKQKQVYEAIKAALEAKDEPVAWMRTSGTGSPVVTEALLIEMPEMRWNFQQPLYTTPPQRKPLTVEQPKVRTGDCLLVGVCASEGHKIQPQRTWVGLTDEEREQVINANTATGLWHMAKDIEAKLKEKNT